MIAYGQVPSRRLGKSLGVNNIPPKACTYACAYCQVGNRLKVVQGAGDPVDFLSFVPDGEPTLDVNLGRVDMPRTQLPSFHTSNPTKPTCPFQRDRPSRLGSDPRTVMRWCATMISSQKRYVSWNS